MNRLQTGFCFELGALGGPQVLQLLTSTLSFSPAVVSSSQLPVQEQEYSEVCRQQIARLDCITDLEITSEKGEFVHIATLAEMQCVCWEYENGKSIPCDALHSLTAFQGFNAGYCCDADEVQWQNELLVSNYELFGRAHDNLDKVWDETFAEWRIDIKKNPGRRHELPGMWLQAAWRMWFGVGAQKLIPKEVLTSFRDAENIECLNTGTVFIELYNDPFASDEPENRRRQQSFRDHVHMDEVVENVDWNTGNEFYLVQEGSFPYGGVRRFTKWLSDEEKEVRRSQATRRHTIEVDKDGNTVWEYEGTIDGLG